MTSKFIFIEDGSVDLENMRKVLDNCGNADVKFITYRQGAAKPELVSIEHSEAAQNPDVYKQEAKNKILDILAMFIDDKVERRVEARADHYSLVESVAYKLVFDGDLEDFMKQFDEYLKKYEL